MAYIREASIERALVQATEARGGIAYKLNVPGRINVPDRLLILPGGRMIFVECKAPGQTPRPGQTREHNRLRALGCECYVLDSVINDWIFDPAAESAPEVHNAGAAAIIREPAYPKAPPAKILCNKEGCCRQRYASGFCLVHYREAKANGTL